MFKLGHAIGVQIYACDATSTGGYAWSFVAPRADLYNARGRLLRHFAGGPRRVSVLTRVPHRT